MYKIPLKNIREIIEDRYTAPEDDYFSKKALVIEDYEALDTVRTVDPAFPITWADSIREKFGIRNIGEWAWAYRVGSDWAGLPVPCDPRALTLLEIMISEESQLVYPPTYVTNEELTELRPYS